MKNLIIKCIGRAFSIAKHCYQINIYNGYRKEYNLAESFVFNGEGTLMYGEGSINIEGNSYIGRFSLLQASKNYKIEIGKNCRIGPFFKAWTQSAKADADFNGSVPEKCGDIIIGDAVWIGANVLISPGVIIGSNSIIGANAVVTHDVPDFAIMGGIPAKLIRLKKNV